MSAFAFFVPHFCTQQPIGTWTSRYKATKGCTSKIKHRPREAELNASPGFLLHPGRHIRIQRRSLPSTILILLRSYHVCRLNVGCNRMHPTGPSGRRGSLPPFEEGI